jgi:hypothetical protein
MFPTFRLFCISLSTRQTVQHTPHPMHPPPTPKQDWHLEVEEQGESGERVLISMKHRLQRTLDEHADAGRHYDWVLLLGGINDLGGELICDWGRFMCERV